MKRQASEREEDDADGWPSENEEEEEKYDPAEAFSPADVASSTHTRVRQYFL